MTKKNILQSIFVMRHYLRIEQPDLFISFIHNINIIAGLAHIGIRTPLIVSERGDPVHTKLDRIWRLLRFIAYQRAERITVLFDSFHSFAAGRYNNKTITIHNPIITPPCHKELNRLIMGDRIFTFVTMTRFSKNKRLDLMLELFASIHAKHSNTCLKILGDGKEKESLIKKVNDLGIQEAVIFTGSTREIYAELCSSDAYLMTSRYEGFPNALVEAMSVGLPAIAFRCHNGLDEIIENGKNSFLISEGDRQSFVSKMETLLENPDVYASMSQNARRISEKFTFEKFYADWNRLFQVLKENNMVNKS